MIVLQILNGNMAGVSWTARHFPVRLGRLDTNDLQLSEPGVWDEHCAIHFDPQTGFTLKPAPKALVSVNQESVQERMLRPGDSIELGGARLRFWIADPARRSLRWPETLVWGLLALVVLAQVWVLVRLLT